MFLFQNIMREFIKGDFKMRFSNMLDLSSKSMDLKLAPVYGGIRRVSYTPDTEGYEDDQVSDIVMKPMGLPNPDAEIQERVIQEKVDVWTGIFREQFLSKANQVGFDSFVALLDDRANLSLALETFLNSVFGQQEMGETMVESPQSMEMGIDIPVEATR